MAKISDEDWKRVGDKIRQLLRESLVDVSPGRIDYIADDIMHMLDDESITR